MADDQDELARLREMLASAIQSLDTACAVRDITEQARLQLLDALQRHTTRVGELEREVAALRAG